jgi:hypothetical protein
MRANRQEQQRGGSDRGFVSMRGLADARAMVGYRIGNSAAP